MKDKNEKFKCEEGNVGEEEIKALPEGFSGENDFSSESGASTSSATKYFPFKFGAVLVAVALVQALAMGLLFVLFMMPRTDTAAPVEPQTESEAPTDIETEENKKGVFDSEETYLSCLRTIVLIEDKNGGLLQSGFVYSSDGYIATILRKDAIQGGRIYVTDSDGKQHKVESIVRDSESGVALLKISADSLRAVDFCREGEEPSLGEELVAIGCYSTSEQRIRIGEASGVRAAMLDVDISLGGGAQGTPLFDREGRLAAVACLQEERNSEYVTAAILASDFQKTAERLKSDNY